MNMTMDQQHNSYLVAKDRSRNEISAIMGESDDVPYMVQDELSMIERTRDLLDVSRDSFATPINMPAKSYDARGTNVLQEPLNNKG